METLTSASPAERRRVIDDLRRKARSVELQAARAAPALASQLKALAAAIYGEAETIEHSTAA